VQPDYTIVEQPLGYKLDNLESVLQALGQVLQSGKSQYTGEELNILLHMLCKASLDTKLKE